MHVGGNQAALNRAFQKKHDDDAVHCRQVAGVELHRVARPESDGAQHDHERQRLEALAARHAAFNQQHDDEIEACQHEPAHDDDIHEAVSVIRIVVFKAVVEGEDKLMIIIGHDDSNQ